MSGYNGRRRSVGSHLEMAKLPADGVRLYGFDPAGTCYCLHCDERVSVRLVMENVEGDWCPSEGCTGGGFGIDLYPDPWWRGQ